MAGIPHGRLEPVDTYGVPEPVTVASPYQIGAHYFPGWKAGTHWGWEKIVPFPERKPLLGWYDEGDPEIADWEIKWCLEHGISYFVYCWYRDRANVGHPLSRSGLMLGHALHEGLFNACYGPRFKFAIMWETQSGVVSSEADLFDNLLPYWMDTYFTRPNYLLVDNKPALFVYSYLVYQRLLEPLGGAANMPRILDRMRQEARRRGFDGLWITYEYRDTDIQALRSIKEWGFDGAFAYCWHTHQLRPTAEQAIGRQLEALEAWKEADVLPFVPTASVGWDPYPWRSDDPKTPWLHPDKMPRWKLTPEEYDVLLVRVKAYMDQMPAGSLGRRMLLLDNWNEWGEGHYLAPHGVEGFGYLDAVRRVFTSAPDSHTDAVPANPAKYQARLNP